MVFLIKPLGNTSEVQRPFDGLVRWLYYLYVVLLINHELFIPLYQNLIEFIRNFRKNKASQLKLIHNLNNKISSFIFKYNECFQ